MQFSPRLMLPLLAVHATVCLVQGPLSRWTSGLIVPDRVERSMSQFNVPPMISQWLRSKPR